MQTKCTRTLNNAAQFIAQVCGVLGVAVLLHVFCRDDVKQYEARQKVGQTVDAYYSDEDWSIGSTGDCSDSGGGAD